MLKKLVIFLFATMLLVACAKDSPEDVTKAFVEKMLTQDFEGAKNYADKETGELMNSFIKMNVEEMKATYDMKDAEITNIECQEPKDDITKCECTIKNGDEVEIRTYYLKKINGEWKVHLSKDI